jgi:hypothetical protein
VTIVWSASQQRWQAFRSFPFASRLAACWAARRALVQFNITNQHAIAGVTDPDGDVVWQGRAERGDLQHDPTDSRGAQARRTRRFGRGGP